MEVVVDSLKVTSISLASMSALCMDILPWAVGITVGIMQIIYLYYKIKKTKNG